MTDTPVCAECGVELSDEEELEQGTCKDCQEAEDAKGEEEENDDQD